MTLYCFINIGVAAYIVGTITLLVVRSDEKTGEYRWVCVVVWMCDCVSGCVCGGGEGWGV